MFDVGDMAIVDLRRERFSTCKYNNLKKKRIGPFKFWIEPFKILQRNGDDTYIVNLPTNMTISRTSDVADLYRYHEKKMQLEGNSRTSSFKGGN